MSRVLDRDHAALVVIDVQEAFRKAIPDFEAVAHNVAVLAHGARMLGLPVIVTEQYPNGLGHTVDEVAKEIEGIPRVEKSVFSAARADGFELEGRFQTLVCGVETHVCVSQTVHDLLRRHLEVHVATDAVSSRTDENRRLGLRKMERSGAILSSVETALFELVGTADADEFREIQQLIL